jgi:hypothetical protein
MDNLEAALEGKKLVDIAPVETGGSNLIEPTKVEIEAIIAAFKDGKDILEIKKTIRRTEGDASLGFSMDQLREIKTAWEAKIAELSPNPEE